MTLVLAGILAAAPAIEIEGLRLTREPTKAGCAHTVDGVSLSGGAPCHVAALAETYPVGTIGEVSFVARSERAYAGRLSLDAGAEVKPHQHEGSVEIVVMKAGRGTFTLDGKSREVGPGDTVVVPKGAVHGFVAGKEPVKAVQFYVPPGPEQRFKPKEKDGEKQP